MGNEELTGLINAAREGDTEALERLYMASYNKVYFYAYKIFGNADDAIDVVQDVFIVVFTKIKTLKEPLSYFNWLSRIVVNRCKEKQRKEGKDRDAIIKQEDSELIDNIIDEEASVEGRVENRDMRKYMLRIIDILPEEQKRAVLLFYYEKLTIAQIAEIEETAEATVKSRLFYARDKIRKALQAEEKRSGVRMLSIGAPAIATIIQQNAELCMMSVAAAQEVFYAALAIVGMEKMAGGKKAVNFVAFNDDERADSFWKKLKSGIIVELKPKKLIALLAVAVIAAACIIAIPQHNRSTHDMSDTGGTGASKAVKVSVSKDNSMTIDKKDIPKAVSEDMMYYNEQFYTQTQKVTPEMAWLRTTRGGFTYTDADLNLTSQGIVTMYFTGETRVVTFFNKKKELIAYCAYYYDMNRQSRPPAKVILHYGFVMNTTGLQKKVKAEVDAQYRKAYMLDESDFFYARDGSDQTLYVNKQKLPEDIRNISFVSNVWTDYDSSLYESEIKAIIAQGRIGKDQYVGTDRYVYDSKNKGGKICDFKYGDFSGESDNQNDYRHNLVALFVGEKLVAVGFLDNTKIKNSPEAR